MPRKRRNVSLIVSSSQSTFYKRVTGVRDSRICNATLLSACLYRAFDDSRYSLFIFYFIYLVFCLSLSLSFAFFEKYNCVPRIAWASEIRIFFGSENMRRYVSVCKFVPAVLGRAQWVRPKTQLAAAKWNIWCSKLKRVIRAAGRSVCFYFLCGEITILPCTRFIRRGAPPIGSTVNDFPQSSFLCARVPRPAPRATSLPPLAPGKVIDI